MKKLTIILALALGGLPVFSQIDSTNTAWMEYLEELSESEMGSEALEHLFDELSFLSEHPFNLHTVTKADLERLPFLSAIQIENLLYYVYQHTPLVSIYELKNVEELDMQSITYLIPFVYIGEAPSSKEHIDPRKIIKYGRNELLLRSDYCFQEKAGFKNVSDEEKATNPNKYYLGENYYSSFKYGFQYKEKIQAGISGEKDFGEPFMNRYRKGFDYYSAHLVVKEIGIVKSLYIGDYRLSFGQGLVVNTDFSMGKTSDVINICKKNSGVKRHFSTGESDFFRGAAVVFGVKNARMSFFGSHRRIDANADSTTIYTIKTDGYNRTLKDLEKRRQATTNVIGGNVQWQNASFNGGLTGMYHNYGGKEFSPEERIYNIHYFRGKANYNLGLNYGFQREKYLFQGETAISGNGRIATINTLQLNPVSFAGFAVSFRNYPVDYQAQYSRAFSESSSVQNESGFYLGAQLKMLRYWEFRAAVDFFKFPWLKYGVDSPSEGMDALLQLNYRPSFNIDMNVRYKYDEKGKNDSKSELDIVLPYSRHSVRNQLNYQSSKELSLKTQFDYNLSGTISGSKTSGWAVSQSAGYNSASFPLKIDIGFVYFHTSDWSTKISTYEKNILYAFNFPSLNGHGIRYYVILKLALLKNLTIHAKLCNSHYFDRKIISSGLEEIAGPDKTEIYCLVRLKF